MEKVHLKYLVDLKLLNYLLILKLLLFLCKRHELAHLIIFYFHSNVLQNRVKQTLTEIRTRYWTSSGIPFVKKLLNVCAICKKINSRP